MRLLVITILTFILSSQNLLSTYSFKLRRSLPIRKVINHRNYLQMASSYEDVLPIFHNHNSQCNPNISDNYTHALRNTAVTVGAAMCFGTATYLVKGKQSSLEFFAAYFVEQCLSIDNLFVFIMLFDHFKIPLQYQARVLKYGIIGAGIMRGIMILFGVAIVSQFRTVLLGFAFILLVSTYKLLVEDDSIDLNDSMLMKISNTFITSTPDFDEDKFFKLVNQTKVATPLFLCLVCIELSDLVFAIDSIPAVLGISKDPFIVYSSNLFAILGLRSLYTVLAKAVKDMPHLRTSVALVLVFISSKMILEFFHYEIPIGLSLGFIFSTISVGVIAGIPAKYKTTSLSNDSKPPSLLI